jgi:hypothetical protein
MIEGELLDQMRSITDRTGVPMSEQVRQGIRRWLESWQWPPPRKAAIERGRRRKRR